MREVKMAHASDRPIVAMLAAGTLAAGMVFAPAAHGRDMTLVSWGPPLQPVQDQVYFQPFEKQTGIKFAQGSWDGGIGILRSKVEGGNLDWDMVEVESDELAIGCEEGLYGKLDWTKIGGKDAYFPEAVKPCGVGTFFYSFVMGWDGDVLGDKPKSWVDFFDLTKFPGKRSLRSGPKTTLEIALMGDGVAPKDVYKVLATPAGVDRAFKKLDTIKSNIIWWQTGNQPIQLLASKAVVMTALYDGRIISVDKNEHKNYKFLWPGSLYTMDYWVILKGSPYLAQCEKLLDFMTDPHRQAVFPRDLPSGPVIKAAIQYVDKDLLPELPSAPQNMVDAMEINVPFWLENYDKLNDRYTKWAAQ
jgi:putative spermidine/putrescine transport system substrate-binding protein